MIIRQIPPNATHQLRHAVLRPEQPLTECVYPGDDARSSVHLGAFKGESLVGIVSLYQEGHSCRPEQVGWRIRGMATDESVRGQGVGKALLKAVIDYVALQNPQAFIWCNARKVASGFYAQAGFEIASDPFDIPVIGPHYVMVRL